jgi:hypothetical protein
MDEHNEDVKNATSPEKFHMMDLSEGWAPLCSMLGTAIPNEPFPRANDAEAVEGLAAQIFMEAGSRWIVILLVAGALVYSAWWLTAVLS